MLGFFVWVWVRVDGRYVVNVGVIFLYVGYLGSFGNGGVFGVVIMIVGGGGYGYLEGIG